METQAKAPIWARIALGVVGLAVLGFTLPALGTPSANPALATLPADQSAVAYGFLFRQLAIALVALFAVYKASGTAIAYGAGAVLIWNLLEGVFLLATEGAGPGSIAGLVFAALAAVAMYGALKK